MKLALALWLNAFSRVSDERDLVEAPDGAHDREGSSLAGSAPSRNGSEVNGREFAVRDAVALNEASTSNGMGSRPHW